MLSLLSGLLKHQHGTVCEDVGVDFHCKSSHLKHDCQANGWRGLVSMINGH